MKNFDYCATFVIFGVWLSSLLIGFYIPKTNNPAQTPPHLKDLATIFSTTGFEPIEEIDHNYTSSLDGYYYNTSIADMTQKERVDIFNKHVHTPLSSFSSSNCNSVFSYVENKHGKLDFFVTGNTNITRKNAQCEGVTNCTELFSLKVARNKTVFFSVTDESGVVDHDLSTACAPGELDLVLLLRIVREGRIPLNTILYDTENGVVYTVSVETDVHYEQKTHMITMTVFQENNQKRLKQLEEMTNVEMDIFVDSFWDSNLFTIVTFGLNRVSMAFGKAIGDWVSEWGKEVGEDIWNGLSKQFIPSVIQKLTIAKEKTSEEILDEWKGFNYGLRRVKNTFNDVFNFVWYNRDLEVEVLGILGDDYGVGSALTILESCLSAVDVPPEKYKTNNNKLQEAMLNLKKETSNFCPLPPLRNNHQSDFANTPGCWTKDRQASINNAKALGQRWEINLDKYPYPINDDYSANSSMFLMYNIPMFRSWCEAVGGEFKHTVFNIVPPSCTTPRDVNPNIALNAIMKCPTRRYYRAAVEDSKPLTPTELKQKWINHTEDTFPRKLTDFELRDGTKQYFEDNNARPCDYMNSAYLSDKGGECPDCRHNYYGYNHAKLFLSPSGLQGYDPSLSNICFDSDNKLWDCVKNEKIKGGYTYTFGDSRVNVDVVCLNPMKTYKNTANYHYKEGDTWMYTNIRQGDYYNCSGLLHGYTYDYSATNSFGGPFVDMSLGSTFKQNGTRTVKLGDRYYPQLYIELNVLGMLNKPTWVWKDDQVKNSRPCDRMFMNSFFTFRDTYSDCNTFMHERVDKAIKQSGKWVLDKDMVIKDGVKCGIAVAGATLDYICKDGYCRQAADYIGIAETVGTNDVIDDQP